MSSKLLDRLLFIQGHCCFFCKESLPREEATVEHLLAKCHDGTNAIDNCVACCQPLNAAFGAMNLKEKMDVVLRQRGNFRCPRTLSSTTVATETAVLLPVVSDELVAAAVIDLQRRGSARPQKMSTLLNAMNARFEKQLNGTNAQALVDHLRAMGIIIAQHDGSVSYRTLRQSA
jgi:hypothetical protein